ncbi:peptide-methionine (S)-S-oxide reductase MsrA [Prochlorococcus sp. MIT 1223]|uniref:peptide-methionine (S)-S-oxide reductase MsrA n=1 Tax=Prochlorococcus sp. MIT 1223 TaxID=3096217 RepID=UPI0039C38088
MNALEESAILAGGCFWCLEHDLEEIHGVIDVNSGYSGGDLINPTYRNHKGHQEVVMVKFDNQIITYEALLRSYLRNIDPLDGNGQFCDRGDSYKPIIFTNSPTQIDAAKNSLEKASKEIGISLEELKVEIKKSNKFWLAEDYHQNFATNNKAKYKFYRYSCGRDNRLKEIWGTKSGSIEPWFRAKG